EILDLGAVRIPVHNQMQIRIVRRIGSSFGERKPSFRDCLAGYLPPTSRKSEVVTRLDSYSDNSPVALKARKPPKGLSNRLTYPVGKRLAWNSTKRAWIDDV